MSLVDAQSNPPAYADVVIAKAGTVVMREGRECKIGDILPIMDGQGNVFTYGEVREDSQLWVNATLMAKISGSAKTWSNFIKTDGAKELVRSIRLSKLNKPSPSIRKDSFCVIDSSKINFKGVDNHIYRGTWVHIDVGTAFAQHLSPCFHAKWLSITGKVIAGDHAAVADVLAETDKHAGTESMATVDIRPKRTIDAETVIVKRVRYPKGWAPYMAVTNGDPDRALDLMEREIVLRSTTPEVLVQDRILAIQRERTATELARQATLRLEYEQNKDYQAQFGGRDVRFVYLRDDNTDLTARGVAGACFYMYFQNQLRVKYGMTGKSFTQRYPGSQGVAVDDMLFAVPAKNEAEADDMETAFAEIVRKRDKTYPNDRIRPDRKELLLAHYGILSQLLRTWNDEAGESGWPVLVVRGMEQT